jgi:hypothetical protein
MLKSLVVNSEGKMGVTFEELKELLRSRSEKVRPPKAVRRREWTACLNIELAMRAKKEENVAYRVLVEAY